MKAEDETVRAAACDSTRTLNYTRVSEIAVSRFALLRNQHGCWGLEFRSASRGARVGTWSKDDSVAGALYTTSRLAGGS